MSTERAGEGAGVSPGDDAGKLASMVEEFVAEGLVGTSIERCIEWVDTDAAGHQHNSAIMRFVEAAEARLFRELGLNSYFAIAPRVRHEVDFRSKLFFGQMTSTAIRVDRLGASSMTFSFKVWGHPHEGRGQVLAAEGKLITACVPVGAASSAPWPQEIVEALRR